MLPHGQSVLFEMTWRYPRLALKNSGKVRNVIEARLEAYIRYRHIGIEQHRGRLMNPNIDQVIIIRLTGKSFK